VCEQAAIGWRAVAAHHRLLILDEARLSEPRRRWRCAVAARERWRYRAAGLGRSAKDLFQRHAAMHADPATGQIAGIQAMVYERTRDAEIARRIVQPEFLVCRCVKVRDAPSPCAGDRSMHCPLWRSSAGLLSGREGRVVAVGRPTALVWSVCPAVWSGSLQTQHLPHHAHPYDQTPVSAAPW